MHKIACVVLPTFNEAENVGVLLPQIFSQAGLVSSHELHVVVVDDESPDGTADVVRRLMLQFPKLHILTGPKQGLGAAYRRGFAYALSELEPDLVFQMDADLQHSPTLIPLFVTLANHGFSLVIGSRFVPGGSTPNFSLRRRLMSLIGNWMIRFFGGLPRIHDCTSGYRCIETSVLKACDLSHLSTRGYSFISSLLYELLRNGARPIEVPITFGERAYGDSKLTFRDQLEFLVNIGRIRFRNSSEFARFAVVGASGVVVNMLVYAVLTRVAHLPLELASPPAIELSLLWNFACHDRWTFRSRRSRASLLGRLLRFHLVTLAAATTNFIVLLALVRSLYWPDLAANLAGIACGVVINYFANSLWTWRRIHSAAPGSPAIEE